MTTVPNATSTSNHTIDTNQPYDAGTSSGSSSQGNVVQQLQDIESAAQSTNGLSATSLIQEISSVLARLAQMLKKTTRELRKQETEQLVEQIKSLAQKLEDAGLKRAAAKMTEAIGTLVGGVVATVGAGAGLAKNYSLDSSKLTDTQMSQGMGRADNFGRLGDGLGKATSGITGILSSGQEAEAAHLDGDAKREEAKQKQLETQLENTRDLLEDVKQYLQTLLDNMRQANQVEHESNAKINQ